MHGFPNVIISTEREGQVTNTTTYFRARQILFDPLDCPDKIQCIAVVLVHSGCNRQHIRIKDDIIRIKSDSYKQLISPLADFYFPFECISLTFLVKSHDNGSCAQLLYTTCMLQEACFTFLQGDRVNNALSLHTHQTAFDNIPFR